MDHRSAAAAPKVSRRPAADGCPPGGGKYSGHLPRERQRSPVADAIHAAVLAMQGRSDQPAIDGTGGQTHRDELGAGGHAALAVRQCRHRGITT